MKIKTQITETKEVEIDLALPAFRQSNDLHYYKIIQGNEIIQVTKSGWSACIQTVHLELALNGTDEITETEFLSVYNEVKGKLDKLANDN